MPYLKPRYELHAGSLRLIRFSPGTLATLPDSAEVLEVLSKKDVYYYNFESYRHLGLLPLSSGIRALYLKSISLSNYFKVDRQADALEESLMSEMVNEGKKHGAAVILLILPNQRSSDRRGFRRHLPDLYGQKAKDLALRGFPVVDAREVFLKSGAPARDIFQADQTHYTPLGNRLIAEALRARLSLIEKESGPREHNEVDDARSENEDRSIP